jgi:tetratricopeptide (TPR) repeat protein
VQLGRIVVTSVPPHRRLTRLSALFSLLVLIVIFLECHWALWYYFDVDFDAQKVLAEIATGGAVGAIYGFLPESNKRYFERTLRGVIATPLTLVLFTSIAILFLIIGGMVNRTKIKWPSGQAEVVIDGQTVRLEGWVDPATNTASAYGRTFSTKNLQVGNFYQKISFRPLIPLYYEIPESAVFSAQPQYQEIVRLLALSFYQSTESRFLDDASNQIASDAGKKFVDLSSVLAILKLCFGGTDIGRSADILLGTFTQERQESPWLPLLQACVHYAHNEFSAAEASVTTVPATMNSPFFETAVFFRGVNQLKTFIEKSNNDGDRDLSLLTKSRLSFKEAADQAGKAEDDFFRKFASGSGHIFEGIAYVYAHDNDSAANSFAQAAKIDYPELRARALSDLGYVTLLRGDDLKGAQTYFNNALEADPTFPYAQTNLGYVLLAEGRYDAARELFVRLSKDELLKRISPRDVVLSQIAIAHLDNEKIGATLDPDAYNGPLKEMGIFNYEGVDPPALRLAKIRLVLADKIYMSHDYYGLEMLALAMYALAYRDAKAITSVPEASTVAEAALKQFKTVSATVDHRCFIFHVTNGFFQPVAEMAKGQNLIVDTDAKATP